MEGAQFPARPDPVSALTTAFAGKPEVVFLLTTRDFPDNEAVVKKVAELNARKAVKVNTIFFSEKYSKSTEEMLQRIAEDSGGTYRYVSPEDLKGE